MTTIAITGATGQLGRLAIAALKTRAPHANLIALVRDPAKARDLDLPTRVFDYTKAADLAVGLAGVDVLILISSSDFNDRAGQHRNVIAAAKAAGVGRVIYTSILHGAASPLLLAADHITTEAALRDSGVPCTILRNGWYTENYTGALGGALAHGALIGAAGTGPISSAARADYAEAIAVVASSTGHDNAVYELAGDTAHTMADLAAEISRQTGTTLPYTDLLQDSYADILQGFGLPAAFAAILADADAQAAKGALFDDSRTLSGLIGRPTTPIAVTVAAALATL